MEQWIITYLVVAPIALVLGVILGYLIAKYFLKKEIKKWQKQMENPDKKQIKNMLTALGQKPSEEQVNRFINMTQKTGEKKKPTKVPKKKK